MKEQVRRISAEYGLNLSEEEIELIARQAEANNQLFQKLYDVDLTNVMPIQKVDKKPTR
ncbi:MAG: hypothetical protein QF619_08885 [Candidatus Binatia bacterium]|jgi:Asp-tRNA(Asn)/Glu-tRNA(Gln) amidotransferase C subunit|nr:hypothetical protein [Candidatus Binatia bacterium]